MRPKRTVRAAQPDVILFSAGSMTFAIGASAVDEIRNLDALTPFPMPLSGRLAKVKCLLVRENKDPGETYLVIDSATHFGLHRSKPARLMVLRAPKIALLVDGIDRMTQVARIEPLPHAFAGAERDWYCGLAIADGRVVPVVKEDSFLTREDAALVAAERCRAQGVSA